MAYTVIGQNSMEVQSENSTHHIMTPISLVRLKTAFRKHLSISSIPSFASFDQFVAQIRGLSDIPESQNITIKWIDCEGDPILVSSPIEFSEMMRITQNSQKPHLVLHIFSGTPENPGMPCPEESDSLYRSGTKKMPKIYHIRGHSYCNKFIRKNISCSYCHQSVWGIFSNNLKCTKCKLSIHKRCYQAYTYRCTGTVPESEGGEEELRISMGYEEDDNFPDNDGHISLRHFRFLSVIGSGSYAKVLAAEYIPTKKVYALKVVLKSILFDHNEDLQSIYVEKEVFRTATNHPFLIGLHSTFQTRNRLIFVIDLANGGDLMAHMEAKQRLSEDHAKFYAAEIIYGLTYLHSNGIIYRDLKLDNVLLDYEGHIKLTDYGLCKINIYPGQKTSTFCGTPNYLAPELITGPTYGFQVDFWALGVLMYEMMSGKSPFEVPPHVDDSMQEKYLFQLILNKTIRIPRFLSTNASQILHQFLDRNPETRLGCNLKTGKIDIENHIFFNSVNWNEIRSRTARTPFKPGVVDKYDLSKLPETFTKRPLRLTKQPPLIFFFSENSFRDVASRVDQSVFEGFEFINPNHVEYD